LSKRQRKPKWQSRIDNLEAFGTRHKQNKTKTKAEKKIKKKKNKKKQNKKQNKKTTQKTKEKLPIWHLFFCVLC
jgi:hypothetical protein